MDEEIKDITPEEDKFEFEAETEVVARESEVPASAEFYDPGKPMMWCNSCWLAEKCPKKRPGEMCQMGLAEIFSMYGKEDVVKVSIMSLLETQMMRAQRAAMFEAQSGGLTDETVGEEIDRYFRMLRDIKKLGMEEEFIMLYSSSSKKKGSGKGLLEEFLKGRQK